MNYHTTNVPEAVQKFAPEGVNVVWETLREPNFEELTGMLAERGRMVIMAGREAKPPFPVGPFYVKGCSLFGFVMFKATPEEQQRAAADISRWLSSGQLKANISEVLSLDDAARSHAMQEANTLRQEGTLAGKILVKM